MLDLTVIVPVKNEEKNLPLCLRELKGFARTVVVVDSSSTDRTPEIAREFGAQYVNFVWDGQFPKKRNWILRNHPITTEWVLFLDADEYLTDAVRAELEVRLPQATEQGFWLGFHNYFQGKLMRHGVAFRKLALFRTGAGEYERIEEDHWSKIDMEVHEHPIIKGKTGEISARIVHQDYKGLEAFIAKHNAYSSWEAHRYWKITQASEEEWLRLTPRQKKKYRNLAKWWWSAAYFVVNYFLKFGFLDGRKGFVFSVFKGIYFYEIRQKILEMGAARDREPRA